MSSTAETPSAFLQEKWNKIKDELDLKTSNCRDFKFIEDKFFEHKLSFQQVKQIKDMSRKLESWKMPSLASWDIPVSINFWENITSHWSKLINELPSYPEDQKISRDPGPQKVSFKESPQKGKAIKVCPAYSDDYVCCGLKVINVAENCSMGCSYCVLENFYEDREIRININLKTQLDQLQNEILQEDQLYRIGTGEYSDSLLWGNQNHILDDLTEFARNNPNVCLELKTKSINIGWLIDNIEQVPRNLVVSWSLNTPVIARAEEKLTPSISQRLEAAQKLARAGILVGFHFHPMVRYQGYEKDYPELCHELIDSFDPKEIIWISQGSLSFIKGQQETLIKNHPDSKLLRTPLESIGAQKMGYPLEKRIELYQTLNTPLEPWKDKVYRYLCMEGEEAYLKVLGYSFPDNQTFHDEMNDAIFAKIRKH